MTSLPINSKNDRVYADRVVREYPGEKYSWFLDLIRDQCPHPDIAPLSKPTSRVHIIDDFGDDFQSHSFDAPRNKGVSGNFIDLLTDGVPDASIRLLIVHFTRAEELNFSYIDAIGTSLDMDPYFFIMHFDCSRSRYDDRHLFRVSSILPLDSRFLQFLYASYGHVTLTRVVDKSSKTNVGPLNFES